MTNGDTELVMPENQGNDRLQGLLGQGSQRVYLGHSPLLDKGLLPSEMRCDEIDPPHSRSPAGAWNNCIFSAALSHLWVGGKNKGRYLLGKGEDGRLILFFSAVY